jgi:uncharacterized membrane protein SpoIIM required for sporulation
MSTALRVVLVVVLLFLAVIFLGAGYVYWHEEARHLPKVLGRIPHAHYHRSKRELLSFIVGGVFLVAALVVAFIPGRPKRTQVVEPNGVASTGV